MTTKSVPQILQEALDWLRDGNKWQRQMGDGKTCGCAGTAVLAMCGSFYSNSSIKDRNGSLEWDWTNQTLKYLDNVCRIKTGVGIVDFNDSENTGFSDIEEIFQTAIAKANPRKIFLLDF